MVAKPLSVKHERKNSGLTSPEPKLAAKKSSKTKSASPPKKRKKGLKVSPRYALSNSSKKKRLSDQGSDSGDHQSAGITEKFNHLRMHKKNSSGNVELSYQTRNSRIKQPTQKRGQPGKQQNNPEAMRPNSPITFNQRGHYLRKRDSLEQFKTFEQQVEQEDESETQNFMLARAYMGTPDRAIMQAN